MTRKLTEDEISQARRTIYNFCGTLFEPVKFRGRVYTQIEEASVVDCIDHYKYAVKAICFDDEGTEGKTSIGIPVYMMFWNIEDGKVPVSIYDEDKICDTSEPVLCMKQNRRSFNISVTKN